MDPTFPSWWATVQTNSYESAVEAVPGTKAIKWENIVIVQTSLQSVAASLTLHILVPCQIARLCTLRCGHAAAHKYVFRYRRVHARLGHRVLDRMPARW